MDTDRSLLRHLLTAALVMFLICGFTVTPIAGAELTSNIYDVYDVFWAGVSDVTVAAEDTDESVDNNPAVPVVEVVNIIIGGDSILVSSGVLVIIAGFLGLVWDGVLEHWDNFVLDVQDAINNLLHTQEWVRVSSDDGQAAVRSLCEKYSPSGGGPKGKKDGKWYFEAHLANHKDGMGKQLEININEDQLLTEDEALREMGRGKQILALTKEMAKKLIGRFKHLTKEQIEALEFEGKHIPEKGWLHHLHYKAKGMDHLHLWSWE